MDRKTKLSRRKFIRTVGLGVAGATLSPQLPQLLAAGATWRAPAEEVAHVRCWMA